MRRRLLAGSCILILLISLGGCWNYRSLDQMSIVVGIAIDFNKENKTFDVSYEIADLAAAEHKSTVLGKIIKAEGKTLFDAARNAKRREEDRLFFGSSYILILNQELARDNSITALLEWFLRDGECRETLCIGISQEDTAYAILRAETDTTGIMSIILHDIIKEEPKVTGTAAHTKLYEAYNRLHSPRKSVLIPALHQTQNGDVMVVETNGSAILNNDRLVGFLTPEQSKYCLMIENELHSGILTLSMEDQPMADISLEVFKHRTKKSYTYQDGKITVYIKTDTDVAIAENQSRLDTTDLNIEKQIEEKAARMIEENIKDVITVLQRKYGADIFGFGEMIHKKDLKLWRELEPRWPEIYPTIEVEVTSKVTARHAASVK